MSAVRGPAPYKFLNPNDDGEEDAYLASLEIQKQQQPKKTPAVVTSNKKTQQTGSSATSNKIAPSASAYQNKQSSQKPQHSATPATDAKQQSHKKPSNDISKRNGNQRQTSSSNQTSSQDTSSTKPHHSSPHHKSDNVHTNAKSYVPSDNDPLSFGREQHRPPPHVGKLKDRPHRGQGDNSGPRRIGFLRKDSLKKEVAGKSTWGHPIESQKEENVIDNNDQAPKEDSKPPRHSYHGDRTSQHRGRFHQNRDKGHHHQPVNDDEEPASQDAPPQSDYASSQPNESSSQHQHQQRRHHHYHEKSSSYQKHSPDNKPLQLTLEEYIASKKTVNPEEDSEPTKKSKGLYVASDDSEWAGIPIVPPTKNTEKDEAPKMNEKKKLSVNKHKSQKVLFTFDEKQPAPPVQESHSNYRGGSRGRGGGYRRDNYDSHKPHRNSSGGAPQQRQQQQSSGNTEYDNAQMQDPQSQQPVPPKVDTEAESKKKFVVDFPALA